jgi:predicted MPP superfamily phosphohydrolase
MSPRITRRQFTVGGLAALAGAGLGYGIGWEPRWLEVRRVAVSLRRPLAAPVRILHLADLHRSSSVGLPLLEEAVRLGLAESPDLACLTGDFITAGDDTTLDGYVDVLRSLSSRVRTFAVYGNHDGGLWSGQRDGETSFDRVASLLAESNIEVLHNRATPVETAGRPLRLAGVGDLWGLECDPVAALGSALANPSPTVVLAHNPDTKDAMAGLPWDLMLSGHTHGGQVVVPFLGPPFVPVRDRRFVAGLNPWGDRQIYTTRGVGNIRGLRFHCRPEVTILDLT